MRITDQFPPEPVGLLLLEDDKAQFPGRVTYGRVVKRAVWGVGVASLLVLFLSFENGAKLLAEVAATLVNGSAPSSRKDQAALPMSKHDVDAGPGAALQVTSRSEIQTPEMLFEHFRVWAAEQDAQQSAYVRSVSARPTSLLLIGDQAESVSLVENTLNTPSALGGRVRVPVPDPRKSSKRQSSNAHARARVSQTRPLAVQ